MRVPRRTFGHDACTYVQNGSMAHFDDTDTVRTRDALLAARLYYQQDLTMEAMARELNLARASVSPQLCFARHPGHGDITVP